MPPAFLSVVVYYHRAPFTTADTMRACVSNHGTCSANVAAGNAFQNMFTMNFPAPAANFQFAPPSGHIAPNRPISNNTITLGEPDEHGRREGWICGRCSHRSPGNLNGWGWTACQSCGADAGAGPTTPAQSANTPAGDERRAQQVWSF